MPQLTFKYPSGFYIWLPNKKLVLRNVFLKIRFINQPNFKIKSHTHFKVYKKIGPNVKMMEFFKGILSVFGIMHDIMLYFNLSKYP